MSNSRNFEVQITVTQKFVITVAADKDTNNMDIMDDAKNLFNDFDNQNKYWITSSFETDIL